MQQFEACITDIQSNIEKSSGIDVSLLTYRNFFKFLRDNIQELLCAVNSNKNEIYQKIEEAHTGYGKLFANTGVISSNMKTEDIENIFSELPGLSKKDKKLKRSNSSQVFYPTQTCLPLFQLAMHLKTSNKSNSNLEQLCKHLSMKEIFLAECMRECVAKGMSHQEVDNTLAFVRQFIHQTFMYQELKLLNSIRQQMLPQAGEWDMQETLKDLISNAILIGDYQCLETLLKQPECPNICDIMIEDNHLDGVCSRYPLLVYTMYSKDISVDRRKQMIELILGKMIPGFKQKKSDPTKKIKQQSV